MPSRLQPAFQPDSPAVHGRENQATRRQAPVVPRQVSIELRRLGSASLDDDLPPTVHFQEWVAADLRGAGVANQPQPREQEQLPEALGAQDGDLKEAVLGIAPRYQLH